MAYEYKSKEVRVKLTKMKLILVSALIISLALIYSFYPNILNWYRSLSPLKEINYYGVPMTFRQDLRLASNVTVYPNEQYIRSIFLNKNISQITLAVLNYTNQTNYIGVEAYEITFKLASFYTLVNLPVKIKGKEVSKINEIVGNYTNPVVYIIPPILSNGTYVKAENYTVYVYGRSLRELDLATIKLISIVLGINLK